MFVGNNRIEKNNLKHTLKGCNRKLPETMCVFVLDKFIAEWYEDNIVEFSRLDSLFINL